MKKYISVILLLFLLVILVMMVWSGELPDRPVYLTTSIIVGAIILTIAIIYGIGIYHGTIKKTDPDYRTMFLFGVIMLPLGMGENRAFLVISLVLMAVGLANYKSWRGQPKWSELDPKRKNLKIALFAVLGLMVIATLILWYLKS